MHISKNEPLYFINLSEYLLFYPTTYKNIQEFKTHQTIGDTIIVDFKYTGKVLIVDVNDLIRFEIVRDDNTFATAHSTVFNKSVKVYCQNVRNLKYVRFSFSEIITNNLFNSEGQPTLASQILEKNE